MNNKEREREELHKTIWKIADELRGSVDGWDFKQYVLGLLFYRFISENIENYVNDNQRKAGEIDFEYKNLSDDEAIHGKNQILEEKGFFILPSELFCNIRKNAKNNDNLNVVISNIFDNIESSARGTASEDDVKGLFDDFDVKGNKLGNTVEEKNEKLVKMINAIGDLNLGDYKENTIDTFGDAYEFLMTMYASNAGKSGGEFFTPQEVGELLARIVISNKKEVNKVYDPCCGSGGLLLKFAKILGKENVKQGFYGQEINLTTYNLARINMFLHDINYNNFNIVREDTLIHPMHWNDEPFDAIVSNPPYSLHWEGKDNPILINDERFAPAGVLAPKQYADLAFTMHMLSWLSPKGTAAIVEFPGILYRDHAEQQIRKYLVDNNYIDAVIQLPENLFFGPSISTCVLVLKKNKIDNNILFIDASEEYIKVGKKNKLTDENINNILNTYNSRSDSKISSLVSYETIVEKKFNLSLNNYLVKNEDELLHNINIANVSNKLEKVIKKQNELREQISSLNQKLDSIKISGNIETIKLSKACNLSAGSRITTAMMDDSFEFDVMGGGVEPTGKYSDYNRENCITISRAGSAGSVSWVSKKFWATDVCFTAEDGNNDFNLKYIYHILKINENKLKQHVYGGSMPKLDKNYLWDFPIPVIDKHEQDILVDVLDKYEVLDKLLKEELELRNEQYIYYCENTFNNKEE